MEREYLKQMEEKLNVQQRKYLEYADGIENVKCIQKNAYVAGVIETLTLMGLIKSYGIDYTHPILQNVRENFGWDRVTEILDIIKDGEE